MEQHGRCSIKLHHKANTSMAALTGFKDSQTCLLVTKRMLQGVDCRRLI